MAGQESEQTIRYTAQLEYRIGVILHELQAINQAIEYMPQDIDRTRLLALSLNINSLQLHTSDLIDTTEKMRDRIRKLHNG